MFKDVTHLRNEIHSFGLDPLEDKIVELARPAVRMIRTRVNEDTLPLGASKLGGNPDVPAGFEWPYWDNRPLQFVGQFKLSEIAYAPSIDDELAADSPQQLALWDMDAIPIVPHRYAEFMLPESGLLHFFYDAEQIQSEQGGWRVLYHANEDTPLTRIPHPKYPGRYWVVGAFPAHSLRFNRGLMLPDISSIQDIVDDQDVSEFFLDHLSVYHDDVRVSSGAYLDLCHTSLEDPRHYFYGYPWPIQDSVEYEIEHRYLTRGLGLTLKKVGDSYEWQDSVGKASEIKFDLHHWQFLFQVDSDSRLAMGWGDFGTLYVFIPKISLLERRFEDCWTTIQCY